MKTYFFGKIIKLISFSQAKWEKKKERTQVTNIRNERRDIITDPMDIKKIKQYYQQLHAHKFDDLDEIEPIPWMKPAAKTYRK